MKGKNKKNIWIYGSISLLILLVALTTASVTGYITLGQKTLFCASPGIDWQETHDDSCLSKPSCVLHEWKNVQEDFVIQLKTQDSDAGFATSVPRQVRVYYPTFNQELTEDEMNTLMWFGMYDEYLNSMSHGSSGEFTWQQVSSLDAGLPGIQEVQDKVDADIISYTNNKYNALCN